MYVQIFSVLTVFGSFYTPLLLLFTTLFGGLLQKPGGIIALLDEAWYVTLIYAFQDNFHLYEKNSDCTYHL